VVSLCDLRQILFLLMRPWRVRSPVSRYLRYKHILVTSKSKSIRGWMVLSLVCEVNSVLCVRFHLRDIRAWTTSCAASKRTATRGAVSFKYTCNTKELVKWEDKIFAPINNSKLSVACDVCLHNIASKNTQVSRRSLGTRVTHTYQLNLVTLLFVVVAFWRHKGALMHM
jgi:hypothetical protein